MVNCKICWIKANWASRPHPIHYTSLLEKDLSTTRPGTREFPNCSSRGHEFDSLFSQFHCVILVDLSLVSMLSFVSLKTMPYSWSFEDLKFNMKFYFDRSMRFMLLDACLLIDSCFLWFRQHVYMLNCKFWRNCSWCSCSVYCSSRVGWRRWNPGAKATVFVLHTPRFSVPKSFAKTVALGSLGFGFYWLHARLHDARWLARLPIIETQRTA